MLRPVLTGITLRRAELLHETYDAHRHRIDGAEIRTSHEACQVGGSIVVSMFFSIIPIEPQDITPDNPNSARADLWVLMISSRGVSRP